VVELIITVKIFWISAATGMEHVPGRRPRGIEPGSLQVAALSGAIAAACDCVYNPQSLIPISSRNGTAKRPFFLKRRRIGAVAMAWAITEYL
jgi:hypothetical protein